MKIILIVLAIAIAGFLAFVVTRPDTYHVERSRRIDAPADVVFAHLDDLIVNTDKMIGGQFAKGLASRESIAKAEART